MRPSFARKIRGSSKQRAQGKPDARCTRGPMGKLHKQNAHEHTGPANGSRERAPDDRLRAIRLSLRNGFNGCFVLFPAIGLSCHRRQRRLHR
jgi:hypothetical protein